jgi:hypothetical protein
MTPVIAMPVSLSASAGVGDAAVFPDLPALAAMLRGARRLPEPSDWRNGVLGALGTLIVLLNAVFAGMSKRRTIWGKLRATVLLLACLGLLWFSFAGNLLHFSSTY